MSILSPVWAKELVRSMKTCSADEFRNFWPQWYEEIISSIFPAETGNSNANSTFNVNQATLFLLEQFLNVSKQFPTIFKEISTKKIPNLLQKLDVFDEENFSPSIVRLSLVLLPYSPQIYSYNASKLRNTICKFNDSATDDVRSNLAKLFGILPILEASSKRSDAWRRQFNVLLIEIHKTLHVVPNETNLSVTGKKRVMGLCKFQLTEAGSYTDLLKFEFENVNTLDLHGSIKRVILCAKAASFMLTYKFDFSVDIPLFSIVELFRCFTIISSNLANTKTGQDGLICSLVECFLDFFTLIPTLTKFALCSFVSDIYDFSETLLRVYSKNSYHLQGKVYELLRTIISRCGAASKFHNFLPKIFRYLKNDLQSLNCSTNVISTCESKIVDGVKGSKKKSRKRKRGGKKFDVEPADQFIKKTTEDRDDTLQRFKACCKLLIAVCQRVGVLVKEPLFRELQQIVCRLARSVQLDASVKCYTAECKVNLYRLVASFVFCRHPSCPPAIQIATEIFVHGAKDTNLEISTLCQSYVQMSNCTTKPMVPCLESCKAFDTLNKPVDGEEIIEESEDEEEELEKDDNRDDLNIPKIVESSNAPANQKIVENSKEPASIISENNASAFEDISDQEETVFVNIDSETDDDDHSSPLIVMEITRENVADNSAKRFKADVGNFPSEPPVVSEKSIPAPVSETDNADVLDMMADFVDNTVD